ncbi:preprotein translocase subunit SecG [Alkaliphilus peptidifermentans]|uniref:Protein-export membrane protein SecG n=1 Tax=Alkaliphilus peptidifermentans DSM 18978 TaxID=1120976 RepID=A0A1G5KUD4_9FIRM|nr:preprotein translocase subunit SecG [Alkaliphilus peptidifermentans]SCZ03738.1 preprotein translocase subunit SecG [Alkaliphilus peptidifermentans DSM 18978]
MGVLVIFLKVVQVVTSIILIGSILMQSGKNAGLSGSIAGGAEQMWGTKGRGYEGMLSKVTSIGAALFIINAIALVAIQRL